MSVNRVAMNYIFNESFFEMDNSVCQSSHTHNEPHGLDKLLTGRVVIVEINTKVADNKEKVHYDR